jgi:hypothetical protein
MNLKNIQLELARNPGHPHGDANHAYLLRAPIDEKGYFDRFKWGAVKQLCTVKRIAGGEVVETGLLVLNRRGQWVFSYAPGEEDDETVFRLGDHAFVPNAYISITEHDGVQRTFKVASVSDWRPAMAS